MAKVRAYTSVKSGRISSDTLMNVGDLHLNKTILQAVEQTEANKAAEAAKKKAKNTAASAK